MEGDWDILWKSRWGIVGQSVENAEGRFPKVLNGVPREYIEGPPRPDPRPKLGKHHQQRNSISQTVMF